MQSERIINSINLDIDTQVTFGKGVNSNMNMLGRFKQLFKFLGPAFIVSVAYIDPGNFCY